MKQMHLEVSNKTIIIPLKDNTKKASVNAIIQNLRKISTCSVNAQFVQITKEHMLPVIIGGN